MRISEDSLTWHRNPMRYWEKRSLRESWTLCSFIFIGIGTKPHLSKRLRFRTNSYSLLNTRSGTIKFAHFKVHCLTFLRYPPLPLSAETESIPESIARNWEILPYLKTSTVLSTTLIAANEMMIRAKMKWGKTMKLLMSSTWDEVRS